MFYIDMHVHTVLGGDSLIRPEEVVPRARELGLDAVCITEHHSWELSRPFDRIARRTGFPILRAMEYRAAEGHLLIYGVRAGKSDFPPGLPMQRVIDTVSKKGGAAVPAHPFQRGINGTVLGSGVLDLKNIAAIETENGSLLEEENQPARRAAEKMGLFGTGGSDAHGLQVLGRAYTVFPEPVISEEDLVLALKKGGFRPGKKPESGPALQLSVCK
ncbi:MAG: PHP domain-containing protein [Desulfobacterales bacterium]